MLPLFFVDQLTQDAIQELTGDEAHHAVSVMRISTGEEIKLADGFGNWVVGRVKEVGKKSLKLEVTERGVDIVEKPKLVVIQAVTKSDRTKEMLELLTVSGADQIIPWQAQRCISKWQGDSAQKWQNSIKEAAKQARRVVLPQLSKEVSTKELIQSFKSGDLVIVLHESADKLLSNLNLTKEFERIILVIGPEGGISEDEITQLNLAGAQIVRMGDLVLRSAHAGFAALSAVQFAIGRW